MANYNPYMNNPYYYGNQYQQNYQPQYQQIQPQQMVPTQMSGANFQQQQNVISGRTVNRVEDIAVNEISMDGSMSFFPNANGQEIYGKKWNSDGTVSTILYRISTENPQATELSTVDYYKKMESNFEDITKQLDDIRAIISPKTRKKEVLNDE